MCRCRAHTSTPCSKLTEGTSARVGVTRTATDRVAYWLDGGVLGELSCQGVNDEAAKIGGRITRLAELPTIKIAIAAEYDDFTRVSRLGRVLTIDLPGGDQIVLDSTPRSAPSERLEAIERFIGALLAAYTKA